MGPRPYDLAMQLDDAMQDQAKALSDPSRFRIFRFIVDTDEPVGVAELTELLGFNHNAIRQHLAVLTSAGLVAEFDEIRQTRGRPRKQYRARADALHAFRSVSGSYERLAHLLLELHGSDRSAFEVGRDFSLRQEPPRDDGPIATLLRLLTVEGFEPRVDDTGGITLENCPFADVAEQNPGVVCELHRGLLAGAAEAAGTSIRVELTPRPPATAGCLVAVAGSGADGSSDD